MAISRVYKIRHWSATLLLVMFAMAACNGRLSSEASGIVRNRSDALPTFPSASATSMLPTAGATATATTDSLPTREPDRIWLQQSFGMQGKITVSFTSNLDGNPCIRYTVSTPVERCTFREHPTLIAAQSTEKDREGNVYMIIVGRVFDPRVSVISLELGPDSNLPTQISDGGFIVIFPGQHPALRAVPIDQYGNLVGEMFSFSTK